jgi:peptide/nickel transport system substrate-binding protein
LRPVRLAVPALALLLCLTVSCSTPGEGEQGGDARRGGSIVVRLAEAPDSLDPAVAASPEALQALSLVYTPLLTYRRAEGSAGTELTGGLAKRPEVSDDGLTWTFAVRDGLRYSDGRPLLASDFERGLRRALRLNPQAAAELQAVVGARESARARPPGGDIEGITADDRRARVEIRLLRPDPELSYALAEQWAVPMPSGVSGRPPGVGPYALATRKGRNAFLLERVKDTRIPGIPQGNLDEIAGRVMPDTARAVAAVVAGTLDEFDGEPPRGLLPVIRSKYKDRYEENRTMRTMVVKMDLARRPFVDRDARRALAYALDERALARLVGGFMDPSCRVLPPQVPGSRPPDPCPYGNREGDPDLQRSSAIVDELPRPLGPVLVWGGTSDRGRALSRYLARALNKIGFRARVARTARERAKAQVRPGELSARTPHPVRYLARVNDRLVRARAEVLSAQGDPHDAAGGWAELDADVVEDATVAPYGVATTGSLFSERLDVANCLRYHPVYGVDWSSLCLK